MKMTKKDFISLSQIIKYKIEDDTTRTEFVRALLPMLYESNPNFQAVVFCLACNVPALL